MNIQPEASKNFTWIEYVRFACAMSVVVVHYHQFFSLEPGIFLEGFSREKLPASWLLGWFYEHGGEGVQIFWGISGFIFFWKYADLLYRRAITGWKFFVLRFSRLYPLHLLTLLLVLALQGVSMGKFHHYFLYACNDAYHFMLQLFFVSHWGLQRTVSFNGPIWSVSVEVMIYVIFYVLVRRMRFGMAKTLGLALAFYVASCFRGHPAFECGAYFFLGGAVYMLASEFNKKGFRKIWAGAGAAGIYIAALFFNPQLGKGNLTLYAGVFSLLILAGVFNVGTPSALKRMGDFLGNLTYASYLIHFPVQIAMVLVTDSLGWARGIYYSPVCLAAYLAAVFGISCAIYRHFELPCQSYLRQKMA